MSNVVVGVHPCGCEFRYDQARARYMDRTVNPSTVAPLVPDVTTWTDYDGDDAYGDWELNGPTVTNLRSFQPGMGRTENPLAAPATNYYHGDHLGTTRLMSDASGNAIEPAVFTAFGEPITPTSDRFGYVGAWGYQAHSEMPFLHVGARYYDPSSGRFLQRVVMGAQSGPTQGC